MSIEQIHGALTAVGQHFEIGEESIAGVRTRVWKNAPASLRQVLLASRAYGDQIYTVYEDERTTFEQHFRRAATLAHRLIERFAVSKGERVAIAMRNYPEWPIAFWGCTAAGAVAVPLNSWGTGDELAYGLSDSGARVLIADGERIERLREHLPKLDLAGVIGVRCAPVAAPAVDFEDVLGNVSAEVALPELELRPDDDATLFYTSGTTGRPKGALGTHRNACNNVMSLAFGQLRGLLRDGQPLPDPNASREPQAYLVSVPFFHVTGCHGVLVGMNAFGGKLVLMHKWDPERALELIEREAVTSMGGVPAMVWQLLEARSFAERNTTSLVSIGYGGAAAPPELLRRIEKQLPAATVSNGYGLTETTSIVTLNAGGDYAARPDSVGPPVPVCELRVVDEAGTPLGPGELGELWIRGPNVVKGYWNRPEATAAEFTNGWFHTGDLVRIDEDGFVTVVDRVKDMVIRGGENVYCAEVENSLFENAAVLDAAVIGVPHRVLGEEVGAVVQLRPGASTSEAELREHVAARLAAFKVPGRIWLRDEPLPRNAAGKVLKRALRESLLANGAGDAPQD
jgi:long-chain acyl-CoA synthetase